MGCLVGNAGLRVRELIHGCVQSRNVSHPLEIGQTYLMLIMKRKPKYDIITIIIFQKN